METIMQQCPVIPLSFAQQRIWFVEQFKPGNTAYNYGDAIRFAGALDATILERSINEVVRRHESLRTLFELHEDVPVQKILPPQPLRLRILNEERVSESERCRRIRAVTARESGRLFDLTAGPLLRLTLLRFDEHDHALIVATHHILFDGWSFSIFAREIMELYSAFSKGRPSPLPELECQYSDFTRWQRQRIQGDFLQQQLAYWKKQLGGQIPHLDLPLDHARPAQQTFNGRRIAQQLPRELSATLRVLARREKATLFMLMLAAFKTLLHRHSGQNDIVVGSVIACRPERRFEQIIGIFVNMLALRTDLGGNPAFKELLSRVRDVAMGAFAHQEMPFDKLIELLQPERAADRSPLFQVNFVFQNTPKPVFDIPNLKVSVVDMQPDVARFDLTLVVTETPENISVAFEYNTDLFSEATVRRMLGHYETLLKGVTADPDCRIDSLPLLTDAERHQLLCEWNNTRADYSQNKTIHELFEEQARSTPDAVAVVFENQALTYSELNARADRFATRLRKMGVGPGVLTGICVERSLEMIVGVLAILKAGGAYVPMDPHYPAARLSFMVKDSGMPVLVTQRDFVSAFENQTVKRVLMDAQEDAVLLMEEESIPRAGPNDLAYVIYTSGSTGQPKSVEIQHRAVVNLLYSMCREPGIERSDVVLSFTTLSFDIAGIELFLPLIVGARIALIDRETARDGRALATAIDELRPTIVQATPSTWRMLLDSGWKGAHRLKALSGGEPLPSNLAEELIACGVSLWNMYGPTETTIYSSGTQIEPGAGPITIGRPIANTQLYILNGSMEPVPIGVAGELYIGGDGLARGYRNRPELNAQRFVPNPFNLEKDARLYKTGDVVRYLLNGNVQYLGRDDNQVKIRGIRIELGEIESALCRHETVQTAVVAAFDSATGKRLVAYVVPRPDALFSSREIRTYLKQSLPEAMVPSQFVECQTLPLTPNGKVDRKALPAPDAQRNNVEEFAAPQNEIERSLAEMFSRLLGAGKIGRNDNFFELGGHSLLVFQLRSRIRDAFKIEIPVGSFFDCATVAQLADLIETLRWAGNQSSA